MAGSEQLLQQIEWNQEFFIDLLQGLAPSLSDLFWMVVITGIIIIIALSIREFLQKLQVYLVIRLKDRYLNEGTCIKYRGFFGTVKKIRPTYILLEKVDCCSKKRRIFRRIPIIQFHSWHKDFYEPNCSMLCDDECNE